MVELSNVLQEELKHKGFFNFTELYIFCFQWLKDEGYKISEDRYEEKLTGNEKEIKIKWTAKKKISDYFRNQIELKWHILRMTDAEVEIDGKKEKTNKGEVGIKFAVDLARDYEERWENTPTLKFLRGIYDKYVVRTTREEYEERLKARAEFFIDQIKAFLTLEGKK